MCELESKRKRPIRREQREHRDPTKVGRETEEESERKREWKECYL